MPTVMLLKGHAMIDAIEITHEGTPTDAQDALYHYTLQDGFLGGRILPPKFGRRWTAQAFFKADGVCLGDWLPDGMRRVLVPDGMVKMMGL